MARRELEVVHVEPVPGERRIRVLVRRRGTVTGGVDEVELLPVAAAGLIGELGEALRAVLEVDGLEVFRVSDPAQVDADPSR